MNINEFKYYNVDEIALLELLPWKHPKTIRDQVKLQIELGNKDKYEIFIKDGKNLDSVNSKFGKRYFISGNGLIKMRKAFEKGTLYVL